MRPKVKICGITSPQDALLAIRLGADFLGLNFYPPSPRSLAIESAQEIAQAVRRTGREVPLVGVFVNQPQVEIAAIDDAVGLDLFQFHGDESPAEIAPFEKRAIKVLRVENRLDPALLQGFERLWGLLVDTRHAGLYGGSGESWDFASLRESEDATIPPRVFIAGGLGPKNVGRAITMARPWGIDLCSGVESAPGRKDSRLMKRLFEEIDHA
jgi:phosphoribosylanthranilate isomerase